MTAVELLAQANADIATLETRVRDASPPLESILEQCIDAVASTLRAALVAAGKATPPADADVLDVWQALVKGEPTWNAIRDNCRELVYYRNCLAAGRRDALPAQPVRMAVRTARHIHLYVQTRALRDGWSSDA